MFISFLSQFWNSIVDTVVGGVTYTAVFFQQIGLAVAGALGSVFLDLFHYLFDVFAIVAYVFYSLGQVFNVLFLPFSFVFNVFTTAIPTAVDFTNATSTAITANSSTVTMIVTIFGGSSANWSWGIIWAVLYALTVYFLVFNLFRSFKKL